MESTIAVILLFVCITQFGKINAKIEILGNTENSDTNDLHLDANQLSNDVDNCHEACLQKVS